MKITTTTDTKEKVKFTLRPIYVPVYALFGLLGVIGGIWTLKLLAVSITIILADDTLTYTNLFLGRFEKVRSSVNVNEIREITVEIPEGTNTVEIVAKTERESLTMPLVGEGGDEKERIAAELRTAIATPGENYRFEDNMVFPGFALGLLVLATGAICLAFLQTSTVEINHVNRELVVRRRLWLLPFISSKRSISLDDFRMAELRSFTVTGRGAPVTSYNVVIVTRSSDEIPVAYGPMFREGAAYEFKRLLKASKSKRRRKGAR